MMKEITQVQGIHSLNENKMNSLRAVSLLLSFYCLQHVHSWTSPATLNKSQSFKLTLTAHLGKSDEHNGAQLLLSSSSSPPPPCRRGFLANSIVTWSTIAGIASMKSLPASAAPTKQPSPQEITDKQNIINGYKRLDYLLTNWEKETTICGRTDNPYIGCERTPEKVMDYLGFKSMNDPLFRIDKTLFRLQTLVAGSDDEIDYMDAMETINQAVEDGNGIAFVSSWGEANPGGGKDRIDLFIERSKMFVTTTKEGLGTIIKILNLKVE